MFKLSEKKRLRKLLGDRFESNENPWVSKLEVEKATFNVPEGKGISIDSVRDIYSRRAWRNDERGKPIDGFEGLLKNLHTTQATTILIYGMVDDSRREYRIFTDSEVQELIGLLRFPVKGSDKRVVNN